MSFKQTNRRLQSNEETLFQLQYRSKYCRSLNNFKNTIYDNNPLHLYSAQGVLYDTIYNDVQLVKGL